MIVCLCLRMCVYVIICYYVLSLCVYLHSEQEIRPWNHPESMNLHSRLDRVYFGYLAADEVVKRNMLTLLLVFLQQLRVKSKARRPGNWYGNYRARAGLLLRRLLDSHIRNRYQTHL